VDLCAHPHELLPSTTLRYKINERASFRGGVEVPPPPQGSSAGEKTDVGHRDKNIKRTERLRNLDRELKKGLIAATAAAAPAPAAEDGESDAESEARAPCRPRIRISGFSMWYINGVYEETSEQGQDGLRVLQHVDDENTCLEWLNGARGAASYST
jgi:hypothetical protein